MQNPSKMPQGQTNKLTSRGTGNMPVTRFLPSPKLNISKMDAGIAFRIKAALDTAPQGLNWRAFAIAMVDEFPYTPQQLESFAIAVNQPMGSPAAKLWNDLARRGFKVKHLIKYLDALRWGHLLLELKPYEPIVLLAAPPEKVILYVGDSLSLSVRATGFPYPQYQWLKGNTKIIGATDDTFSITSVRCEDEGTYCCLLYNTSDREQNVFTVGTGVQVRQTAQQASWPGPSHSYMEPGLSDQLPVIVNDPCRDNNITVRVGEPFTLECAAAGPGPLEYRWMRNGQFLPCLISSYTTEHAMVVDSGSYQCCVKNPFGEVRSQVYQVKVIVHSTVISGASTGPKPSSLTHHETFLYNNATTLDIVAHPKSCAIEKGGSALFTCQAIGQAPLSYQWFKDGQPIPGETTDSLCIRQIHSYDTEGVYQCRVWNNTSELLTTGACLNVDLDNRAAPGAAATTYTAADKIALLIGNYDYISADQLRAPKTDVLVLAEIFRSMDYKVVSLLNLTLGEMEAAVAEFCSLLKGSGPEGSGVYGVFYFCGHGIEEIGQVYLVPQDAPTAYSSSNCLCAQKVLRQMQEHRPALCTMIIDCCRMMPDNPAEKKLQYYPPLSVGNFANLFATTVGLKAYEYDNHIKEPNGVLVKHLQRHLNKRRPIEDVFRAVREDIGADPKLKSVQIPELRSNLVEHSRSLADITQYSGQTQVFNSRTLRWKNAHLKPENTSVYIKELGVTVDVEYQSEFSNVLSIYLTVRDTGHTSDCSAWVVNLPPTLSVMEPHVTVGHSPVRTKTVILDIQKLKENLTLTIQLRYCLPGAKRLLFHECHPIDIGRPLVAPLELWREPTGRREPIEQGDGPAYLNLGPDYENMQDYENFPQAFLRGKEL